MPRFSPEFLDELRTRLRASDIIGRHVKLKKEGREWRGLSPFTSEKTPSFFVNDEKARYFDFSSGKSGDIIGFTMDMQKLSFVEAVTRLAEEAGMEIPKDSHQEQARQEKAVGLIEAHEAAAKFYQDLLYRADGRDALEYSRGRGLSDETIKRFGLGYAPASQMALKDHLINKGFAPDLLVEAGLLIRHEQKPPYDRFRDRLMFPILNQKNRPIAFGGRALSASEKAKYLNSPETPLFHKGSVLYNLAQARAEAAKMLREADSALIVCEGYMDVIALAQAGFGNAVAPLGTALTESHLSLLWRVCDEPFLCFDGDRAGRSAAYRSIDRALPLLKPGKSLRFVFMPEGQDPDDLVRQNGPKAFRDAMGAARPLVSVLWDREEENHSLETPEKRAFFRQELRRLVQSIKDKDVRQAYGAWIADKLLESFGAGSRQSKNQPFGRDRGAYRPKNKTGWGQDIRPAVPLSASPALKAKLGSTAKLGRGNRAGMRERERLLVLTLLNHPDLFRANEAEILGLSLEDPDMARLLSAYIDAVSEQENLDIEGVRRHIQTVPACAGVLESLLNDQQLTLLKFTRPTATLAEAETGWRNTLSLHLFHGLTSEEAAELALESLSDETGEARWRAFQNHRRSMRSQSGSANELGNVEKSAEESE